MANLPPLTLAQKKVLMTEGTFNGLKRLVRDDEITEEHARGILIRSYDTLLGEIREAKKEMLRIQTALLRLENLMRKGKQSRAPFLADPVRGDVGVALDAFDGWVVSLMETNMTMTGMLNPRVTRAKIKDFGTAMNALMDKRLARNHPAHKDPDLFDGYVNNWRTAKPPAASNVP
ncbi:MAG: hypothetical protein AB7F88_10480 [Pyrinomonadaceae bacterium]